MTIVSKDPRNAGMVIAIAVVIVTVSIFMMITDHRHSHSHADVSCCVYIIIYKSFYFFYILVFRRNVKEYIIRNTMKKPSMIDRLEAGSWTIIWHTKLR